MPTKPVIVKTQTVPSPAPEVAREGVAGARMHFGEYLQGSFDDLPDKTDRAAISVLLANYDDACKMAALARRQNPAHALFDDIKIAPTGSKVVFEPAQDAPITLSNNAYNKSKRAAELTLAYLGKKNFGGHLNIEHSIPEGHGLGTSTSDVVATIRAIADGFYSRLTNSEVAGLAVRAEGACDSVMFSRAGLFVTTKCVFKEYYDINYPRILILGLDAAADNKGIDTLSLPKKDYTQEEKQKLELLRKSARYAFTRGDTRLIGQIATTSGAINQRFIQKPCFDEIVKVAADGDADGVICAHSGTALGIFFDLARPLDKEKTKNLLRNIRSLSPESLFRYYAA
jgi:uncharacterized protein involved in propanediol utilization